MVEVKIAILFLTILIIVIFGWLMRNYRNAARMHLYLFSALWLVLLGIEPFIGEMYNIGIGTYLIFNLTVVLFFLGAFFALPFFYQTVGPAQLATRPLYDFPLLRILMYSLVVLSLIANVLYYRAIISQLGNIMESLALLRTESAIDAKIESSNMFFNTFGRIYNIYLPVAFYLYRQKEIKAFSLVVIAIISFLIAAASLTRAPVLNVVIIILVCIYVLKIRFHKTAIAIAVAGIFSLLYYSTKEIEKLTGSSDFSFVQTTAHYFLGGMKSFESMLQGHYHPEGVYDSPYYSLDFINYFVKRVGLIDSYPPLERAYSDQIYTNVYTYLDAFTLDWGILGLLFCPILIGFLCGFFGCMVKASSNWVYLVMYCYGCYALSISFMNNEFIRSSFFIVPSIAILIHLTTLNRQQHNQV